MPDQARRRFLKVAAGLAAGAPLAPAVAPSAPPARDLPRVLTMQCSCSLIGPLPLSYTLTFSDDERIVEIWVMEWDDGGRCWLGRHEDGTPVEVEGRRLMWPPDFATLGP